MAASSSTSTVDRPSQRTAPRRSRAVLRDVEPGSTVECAHCDERVKFQAKVRNRQVICNVYIKGVWDRVEHFHADCYDLAGEPHGPVDTTPVVRNRARAAEAKTA
ncbi:MAG TPA: hypothetical protein P5193_09545 [Microthrixaceae bacterium]|nr:hypothetical protein [Microthrixaceae bacterium]RTL08219.1 MAG: hypothetical protein EKK62_08875 [Acidimicrobiia bacterium]HNF84230.1 hypothetical protein [Solirubrobacterales bacterium]MCB9400150.1 hypothetical protein [Microthrixaceae bacterium]MCC6183472.1 hypothetical protein [Microthrixaceae bacterium]